MWTVVYIAVNRAQAETLKNLLTSEGILADTRPLGAAGVGDGAHEILVLQSEVNEAHEILCQFAIK
ncbi:MAG: hypothetical protein E6713_16905 [Sporomusaceae bacterium]|nr:hypothetical protein [Sporomusaceae bacterium]